MEDMKTNPIHAVVTGNGALAFVFRDGSARIKFESGREIDAFSPDNNRDTCLQAIVKAFKTSTADVNVYTSDSRDYLTTIADALTRTLM